MTEPEVSAEDEPAFDYVSTMLVVRELNGRRTLVIPKDVTAFEAACWSAFIMEFNERHVLRGWRLEDRLEHFGLGRFLIEGDKS